MDKNNKETVLTKAFPRLKPGGIVRSSESKDVAVDMDAPQFLVYNSIIGS